MSRCRIAWATTLGALALISVALTGGLALAVSLAAPPASAWASLTPAGSPAAREAPNAAVWDPDRNQMLLFGGQAQGGATFYNDLWAYRPTPPYTWTQLAPTGTIPGGRDSFTTVWDSRNKQMLVFGGFVSGGGKVPVGEYLYAYTPGTNPDTGVWTRIDPVAGAPAPSPRNAHSAVWDTLKNRMLVFGSDTRNNELWAYYPPPRTRGLS